MMIFLTLTYMAWTTRLADFLSDDTPRVIMLDQTFDFLETEGSTEGECCSDDRTTKCPDGTTPGQLWIQDTCDEGTWEPCTYWNAPREPLTVGSDKSIVGVGDNGVMRGKGLRINSGASNVIIQNIHFTVRSLPPSPRSTRTSVVSDELTLVQGTQP